ncbi:MAG: quinone-dependent dihydroorotate dehydrogenase [Pseudomonadales bacterium]
MYSLVKSGLFLLPAEAAHDVSFHALTALAKVGIYPFADKPEADPVELMGIQLANPVGLAAGLDKNGAYLPALSGLGFGFIEVGTVTPKPQPGNPKPRIFRLPQAQAIINRMGFNNDGIDKLLSNVNKSQFEGVLGINIGKNKDTPADEAVNDYLICLRKAYPHASYITVNLSSPNTPGLRDLQFGEPLKRLLGELKEAQQQLAGQYGRLVPIAVKIAPDLALADVESVAKTLVDSGMDGVIATNTTIAKEAVSYLPDGDEAGGLSGAPLTTASTRIISELTDVLEGKLPIIGVGGIMCAEDALAKRQAGAKAVQLYTGFIYQGPRLIGDCARILRKTPV